jgi:hypothetical protein
MLNGVSSVQHTGASHQPPESGAIRNTPWWILWRGVGGCVRPVSRTIMTCVA